MRQSDKRLLVKTSWKDIRGSLIAKRSRRRGEARLSTWLDAEKCISLPAITPGTAPEGAIFSFAFRTVVCCL